MITFCIKPYKTITHDSWLFKKYKSRIGYGELSAKWQRIEKLFWFVYLKKGPSFLDTENMFKPSK